MLVLKSKNEIFRDLDKLNISIKLEQKNKLINTLFEIYKNSSNAYYEAIKAISIKNVQDKIIEIVET